MKRIIAASITGALVLAFAPADATAQWAFLGASATVPVGDYADFGDGDGASTGYMANGGVMFPVGEGKVSVGAQGFFGTNGHDTDGDKTNLYGATALAGVTLAEPDAATRPFVFGGLGLIVHSYKSESFPDFEGSENGLAATGGAGVAFTAGESLGIMLSGSYTLGFGDTSDTTFLALGAAAQIPLG